MQIAQELAGYSSARPTCCAAPWARRSARRWRRSASDFVAGARRARHRARRRPRRSSMPARNSPTTASTRSTRRAYALRRLSDRLYEGELPVEFLAASMTLDMGNTDKLAEFRAEAQRLGIKVEPPSVNRSGVAFEVAGNTILLCAGRAQRRRRAGGRGDCGSARRAAFRGACRFREPRQSALVNKRVLESLAAAGAFDALEHNRARVFAAVDLMLASAQRTQECVARGPNRTVRRPGRARRAGAADGRAMAAGGTPAEGIRRDRLLPVGPSARRLCAALKRLRLQSWARVRRAVKSGVERRPCRRHGGGARRAPHPHRQQDGHHRAVRSHRALRGGDLRRRAAAVPRRARDRQRGGAVAVRPRCRGRRCAPASRPVEPLDRAAANLQKGLRVFLRDEAPIESVAKRLQGPPGATARAGQAPTARYRWC